MKNDYLNLICHFFSFKICLGIHSHAMKLIKDFTNKLKNQSELTGLLEQQVP